MAIRLGSRYIPLPFRTVNGGAGSLRTIAVWVLMGLGLVLVLGSFAAGFEPG